ncbi:MAG TPA: mechanosensitive ion channel domain-containing protein [Rhizomicrobium sp.]|jgi:small-conductance mechanosensitive channel|nr:mechanosensitive ion channel domain-containing protein [Rhizomicrobium sp.]
MTLSSTIYRFAELLGILPNWLVAVLTIAAAVVVSLGVFRLLSSVLTRILQFDYPVWHSVVARTHGLLRFAVILLTVALVVPALPLSGPVADKINRVLIAAFVVLLGWVALIACNLAIERYVGKFKVDTNDNLSARKVITQMRVLRRTAQLLIVLTTAGFALMTFDSVRQFGVSLFASAGVAGLALGLAAKPLLGNLIAGVQIALTQPIRIDDAVVVENEWGWIEEISASYVVIRLWDWRRLVVPLGYFLENPFQNWTRTTASLIGVVYFHLDYRTPVATVRAKLEQLVRASKNWDGQVVSLQITNTTERTIEVRALMSASNSSRAFDLRCEIREKLLEFLQQEHPEALPRLRAEVEQPFPSGRGRNVENRRPVQ